MSDEVRKKYAINYLCSVDNYELCADEFSFDFCGYTGTFFLDFNGKWQVNSEDNIRVEFDEKTGFESIANLTNRFPRIGTYYEAYQRNTQFFKEFTLITSDGTRWTFGGEHAVEYSIPYYHQNTGDLIATSWKLKRVMTVDGEFATFEYKDDAFTCDIHYSPQYSYSHLEGDDLNVYSSSSIWDVLSPISLFRNVDYNSASYDSGRSGLTGSLTMPSRLTKISTLRDTIGFSYMKSYEGYRYFDQTGCLYWTDDKQNRMEMYNLSNNLAPELRPERFYLFVNPDASEQSSDRAVRAAIAYRLTNYLLDSIIVSGDNALDIAFNWKSVSSVKLLSEICFCQQPNGIHSFTENKSPISKKLDKLSGLNEPLKHKIEYDAEKDNQIITDVKTDSCSLQIVYSYKFDYWHDNKYVYEEYQWPEYRPMTYTDSWGYFANMIYSVPINYGGTGGTCRIADLSGDYDPDLYMDKAIDDKDVENYPYTGEKGSTDFAYLEKNDRSIEQDYVKNNVIDEGAALSSGLVEGNAATSKAKRAANSSVNWVRGYWKFSDSFSAKDFHELTPSLPHAKTYTLRRMCFPSGAYAEFDYELRDVLKISKLIVRCF